MFSARLTRNRAATVALIALTLALQPWTATSAQAQRGGDCNNDSLGLTPLIDMGSATYMGAEGGLYPGGSNTIPADHLALGMSLMNLVGPLNAEGQPDEAGKIGFMGVGVSTTGLDWDGFASLVSGESGINPQVALVNGGVSGEIALAEDLALDGPFDPETVLVAVAGLGDVARPVTGVLMARYVRHLQVRVVRLEDPEDCLQLLPVDFLALRERWGSRRAIGHHHPGNLNLGRGQARGGDLVVHVAPGKSRRFDPLGDRVAADPTVHKDNLRVDA